MLEKAYEIKKKIYKIPSFENMELSLYLTEAPV